MATKHGRVVTFNEELSLKSYMILQLLVIVRLRDKLNILFFQLHQTHSHQSREGADLQ